MTNQSISIIGLPGSGKTTFLAALWHLIFAQDQDMETALRFDKLIDGDTTHLNQITGQWLSATEQNRTVVNANRTTLVSMKLKNTCGDKVDVTFPDTPGELCQDMWRSRDCPSELADILTAGNVLLFIHADIIIPPRWITDETTVMKKLGIEIPEGEEVAWHPLTAPTQVQLVDLLQHLSTYPLNIGPRKLGVMLSAWDKAEGEGVKPKKYLESKMPLLAQYLSRNADNWDHRIYGLSAQGCEYDSTTKGVGNNSKVKKILAIDNPSERIKLVSNETETHDLTEPLAWLME